MSENDNINNGGNVISHVRPIWQKVLCFSVVVIGILLLFVFEALKPTLTSDELLNRLYTMVITRMAGAVVFFALLLYSGYKVLNPFKRPFVRSILFSLPAFAVVINNMPILSLIWGDAYIIKGGNYMFWFVMECLAIGLFEEAAFRGVILLSAAEQRHGTKKELLVAVLLSSAIFGGVHLVNLFAGAGLGSVIRQIGYSFLIGAMCSVVLLKTANIWLCVLLHAVYDFCGNLVPTLGAGTWWDVPTIVFTVILALGVTAYMLVVFIRMKPQELDRIYVKI